MSNRMIRDVVPPSQEIEAGEEQLSPASILRAQADTWTQRTHGEIVGEVEPARAASDKLAYWFSFVVPSLDGYRYRLFRVEHGVDFYPLRIAAGRMEDAPVVVHDEDQLYDELRRIFAESTTLNVVRQLRALAAEQRRARAAG